MKLWTFSALAAIALVMALFTLWQPQVAGMAMESNEEQTDPAQGLAFNVVSLGVRIDERCDITGSRGDTAVRALELSLGVRIYENRCVTGSRGALPVRDTEGVSLGVRIYENRNIRERGDPLPAFGLSGYTFTAGDAEEEEEEEEEEICLTWEDEDTLVTLVCGPEADLPEDAVLRVREYEPGSDEYIARSSGTDGDARVFSVGLYVPGTGDSGDAVWTEIEPDAPVEVTISYLSDGSSGYTVTHFGEDGTETIEPEVTRGSDETRISFQLESFSDIMVVAEKAEDYASPTGQVVLNLGNGNGKYNNADYTNSRQEGTLLRYTTDSLTDYADSDGKVTVNLPSDGDLDSTFTVVDAAGSLSAVTVELGSDLAYDYKLVGWVNIATGEYYDVSNGSVTAEIDLSEENVFYADWVAASYDHGSSSDADLRDDTVSTSGFVTIHMYDYNELFNLYSESVEENLNDDGSVWEAWTDSGKMYSTLMGANDDTAESINNSFIFVNNGTVRYSGQTGSQESTTGGMLTWPNYKTSGNTWTGSGAAPRDAYTEWGITSPASSPLDMLFDPTEKSVGVHYVGEADYLFWIDGDGYYTYNSKEAAATYNQSDERFYVYDGIQDVAYTDFSCFLPYNTYGSSLSALDGTVDYFFGMDMTVDFYLPNATGTAGGNQMNGKDMVFDFSGDDDIFIFIDGVLVLDMSGIHDEAFGSINFADGTITMGMSTDSDGNILNGTTTDFSLSSGNHTLQVYYMERGGYASNLEIQFNVVPRWEYETGPLQTVYAQKEWNTLGTVLTDEATDGFPDVEFGLFEEMGYIQTGDTYTVNEPHSFYGENYLGNSYTIPGDTGYSVDNDGLIDAYLENGKLYVRVDRHTMSYTDEGDIYIDPTTGLTTVTYGWYYTWEVLEPDGEYTVRELTGSYTYTARVEPEAQDHFYYWTIIGENEMEDMLKDNTGSVKGTEAPAGQVILTDAAQHVDSSGNFDPDNNNGHVVVMDENRNITTELVLFSQGANEEILESDEGYVYSGTYGAVGGNSVAQLNGTAVWNVETTGDYAEDIDQSSELDLFRLYIAADGSGNVCIYDEEQGCFVSGDGEPATGITKYYLTEDASDRTSLAVTTDAESAYEFYDDAMGELRIHRPGEDDGTGDFRIVYIEQANGQVLVRTDSADVEEDDGHNVKIYSWNLANSSGWVFTINNTVNPDLVVEKVDGVTGDALSGVSFSLMNEETNKYYAGLKSEQTEGGGDDDDDENAGTWDDEIIWSDDPISLTTDETGEVTFRYLPDGTYILTETAAPDGYNTLPSAIRIVIQNGVIQSETEDGGDETHYAVEWAESVTVDISNYVTCGVENALVLTVENIPGTELPNTGGPGTRAFTAAGLALVCGAAAALLVTRRRRYGKS